MGKERKRGKYRSMAKSRRRIKNEMGDKNGGKKGSHEMEDGKITSK